MRITIHIADLMERNQITNEEMSDLMDVSRGTVAMWKSGERTPTIGHLGRMLDVFGCELGDLITAE